MQNADEKKEMNYWSIIGARQFLPWNKVENNPDLIWLCSTKKTLNNQSNEYNMNVIVISSKLSDYVTVNDNYTLIDIYYSCKLYNSYNIFFFVQCSSTTTDSDAFW